MFWSVHRYRERARTGIYCLLTCTAFRRTRSGMRAIVLTLFLTVGCSGVQGVPMAPRAPSFSPTLDAPITVGQPGYIGTPEQAPRGTDKRVLPPTKEPGIWASDGELRAAASAASDKPYIGPVEIPFPDDADSESKKAPTSVCAMSVTQAIKSSQQWIRFLNLPSSVQQCTAAKLYKFCAEGLLEIKRALRATGSAVHQDVIDAHQSAAWKAQAFFHGACSGGAAPSALVYDGAAGIWLDVVRGGEK